MIILDQIIYFKAKIYLEGSHRSLHFIRCEIQVHFRDHFITRLNTDISTPFPTGQHFSFTSSPLNRFSIGADMQGSGAVGNGVPIGVGIQRLNGLDVGAGGVEGGREDQRLFLVERTVYRN